MDKGLYEAIFKRKSFHLFRDCGEERITQEELRQIEEDFNTFTPLDSSIKVKIKITDETSNCKRGQDYCIWFYSEIKDCYLENIGYLGEQLDLYLVKRNIGTLWFGIGKVKEKVLDGLNFVIMMAIRKIDSSDKFRKDMYKSKRKEIDEVWQGDSLLEVAQIVRFAPSACNSQPWVVYDEEKTLKIYRESKRRGIMPKNLISYYNQIDMGIFMCFMDLCLEHNNISYKKEVFKEKEVEKDRFLDAIYYLS